MAPPGRVRFAKSKDAIGRELDIARARKEFFPGRSDVSDQRALNRQRSQDEIVRFKNQFTRPTGVEGLVQMTPDAPMDIAAKRMELSNRFGPTLADIGSDFRFGMGRFFDDLRVKGTPVVQLIRSAGSGISDFFTTPFQNMQNQEGSLAMQIRALTPEQRREYDRLVGLQGFTIQEALKRVTGMAMGGIATLQ